MIARTLRSLRTRRSARVAREIAALVASYLDEVDAPLIGLHQPSPPGIAEALRAALPAAEVLDLPREATQRHLLMTHRGRFDAVVDAVGADAGSGLRSRFDDTFWHVTPGGPYVVPGGAEETGGSSPLAVLRRDAGAHPGEPLRRRRRSARRHIELALRNHVSPRVAGHHVVLTHELPDVLVKVREQDFNAYLAGSTAPRHRLLEVIPAGDPPPPPTFREAPGRRTPRTDRPIERADLSLRDYRDVVVAPMQVVVDGRVLLPDTYRHNAATMLRHNALADLAPRFAVSRRPIPSDLPRLRGTFVHLDNEVRGHFGHVLTETLSRIWAWERALEIDPDARAVMGASRRRPQIAEWEYEFYAACGIPRDRIVLLEPGRPVQVERLISGTPMWSQPQYVHPRIRETWRRVGDTLAVGATDRDDWPRRIFVSRRILKRACANGDELEAVFRDAGFDVVHPEDHALGDQVALFRNAEVIAGYGGSGMFQTLLVPEPRHVIQVASEVYSPRNEYLIAAVLGHRLDSVLCQAEPYDGRKPMHAPFRYDPEREGPLLRELLASLPPLAG